MFLFSLLMSKSVSQIMIRIINLSNITTLSRHGWQINTKTNLGIIQKQNNSFLRRVSFAKSLIFQSMSCQVTSTFKRLKILILQPLFYQCNDNILVKYYFLSTTLKLQPRICTRYFILIVTKYIF